MSISVFQMNACMFSSFFFQGFWLGDLLASGSGSGTPLIELVVLSLSIAILRLFGLAEQRQTQNFYLRCFKLDIDAVKSKFDLLIE